MQRVRMKRQNRKEWKCKKYKKVLVDLFDLTEIVNSDGTKRE